jgi:hypothetical protein
MARTAEEVAAAFAFLAMVFQEPRAAPVVIRQPVALEPLSAQVLQRFAAA